MPRDASLLSGEPHSLALLHDLGDAMEVGVLVLDRELVVRGWNRWLVAASGWESTDVVGRGFFDVFAELRGGPAENALRGALGGATTVWSHQFHRYFLPLPAPSGHDRFTRMQQSARIMPLGREESVDGVLALVHDVTERVAREEELRQALQRAEVASQAKSDFLASMSHELRTPLSAVIGYMDLLEGEMVGPVSPLQKSYLGRVRAAARHLIGIIEEILTFSRVEAGREPVHIEPTDVGAMARAVGEMFEPQALEKGLTLAVSVPDHPVTLSTDVTKLRQILINLVGNAVKFTDAGRVALQITTTADRVLFSVRDNGPGILSVDLERIFEPFTQVDQTLKRGKGGTGLGLPVSLRLAHLLGGDLTVRSVPGEGTTFTLWLPLASRAPYAPATTPHERLLPQH